MLILVDYTAEGIWSFNEFFKDSSYFRYINIYKDDHYAIVI